MHIARSSRGTAMRNTYWRSDGDDVTSPSPEELSLWLFLGTDTESGPVGRQRRDVRRLKALRLSRSRGR
jgi:hypothetical protein